jgi:homoserine acetyltransferase
MRKLVFGIMVIVSAAFSQPSLAQQEGTFVIPEFQFEKGGKLTDMKVGYITWGKLNDARHNALLMLPATNAPKAWAAQHIGPGKAFDTDKYFVIGVDPIGAARRRNRAMDWERNFQNTPSGTWCEHSMNC